jgi:GntR family transcriptional regulator
MLSDKGLGGVMGKAAKVADALRHEIEAGRLRAAEPLPSEARLVERFDVSRGTIREAVGLLRQEGLVVSYQGKGSFVRAADERARHTHTRFLAAGPDGAWVDVATRGWEPVDRPTTYRGTASADLALALGVEEHSPLFVHDRLLVDAEGRRQAHRLYLPVRTVLAHPALEREPFVTPEQLYRVLRADGGALTCFDFLRARVPSPADAATLDLSDGGLMFVVRRAVRSEDGRTLALEETKFAAHDTQIMMQVAVSAQGR